MSEVKKNYEALLIFTTTIDEEATTALLEKMKAVVSKDGTLGEIDEWGKRKLAYPINDETEGYYVIINFESGSELPAEFERIAKITDGVLRILITAKA